MSGFDSDALDRASRVARGRSALSAQASPLLQSLEEVPSDRLLALA
ncbi:hypothetical protein [Rhodoferax antarcticus]|nr:hypothetical protein [Rhodoferax antarcticus]MCW2312155.1 hypothetical protein [Rhodoferax antarcticus]